jgi:hypothetical protein
MASCTSFLEGKMKLTVNKKKSKVGSPFRLKFLGFSLCYVKGKVGIRIHATPLEKFKKRVREITSRKRGRAIEQVLQELNRYTTGWLNYYRVADVKSKMEYLTQWIRRRLRMYIWKQWKKVSAKFRNLQKFGADKQKAWEWANTRLGYWRIALSWILTTTLTNKYLESLGYKDIAKRYEALRENY